MLTMTAVVRRLKIKKEQGIILTAISDNSNRHHTLESQDTSILTKINNQLTGSVANCTSTRPVTKDDYLWEI
jgi:hypothetical protein